MYAFVFVRGLSTQGLEQTPFSSNKYCGPRRRSDETKVQSFGYVVLWNDEYCMWTYWKGEVLVLMALEKTERGYNKLLRNDRSCSALLNGQYFSLLIKSRPR